MLDVLRKHGIRAVGFVTWERVLGPADRALLGSWLDAGHELGNHTWTHPSYTSTGAEEVIADAERARMEIARLLEERGGAKPAPPLRFFRFPLLREGDRRAKLDAMRAWLAESGLRNLPVTLDDQDWWFEAPWVKARIARDRQAMARVAEEYHESLHLDIRHHERLGDELFGRPVPQVLLLHATEVGAAQWDRLFAWLRDRGYRFATADEVLGDPAFSEPDDYLGDFGPSLWERIADTRTTKTTLEDVRQLIATQVAAWNRGDLDEFTSVYAEDATFVSPSGLTQGRSNVLERYRRRTPDRRAMGHLGLDIVEMRPASGAEFTLTGGARPSRVHGVSVVGRWRISYPDEPDRPPAEGLTLIVLTRSGGGWQIVQDASM
jgi:peptidoglycan/xylan/chitin deacetylase (PgdA/CDA1 family)